MEKLKPEEHEFFLAVRRGQLTLVEQFIKYKTVKVNCYDSWGNSPLYLSCLCGHYYVAEFLLKNGAHFDRTSAEGYRALIASLTQNIRDLLKKHHKIQAGATGMAETGTQSEYELFLGRLVDRGIGADTWFVFDGQEFPVHRCVLSARAAHMAQFFADSWKICDTFEVTNYFSNDVTLRNILCYLYLGRTGVINYEDIPTIIRDCKELRIPTLATELEKETYHARKQHLGCLASQVPVHCKAPLKGLKVTLNSPERLSDVQKHFAEIALHGIQSELRNIVKYGVEEATPQVSAKKQKSGKANISTDESLKILSDELYFDIILQVEDFMFYAHKAFIVGRSDYFHKLLLHDFEDILDNRTTDNPPVVPVGGVTPEVFAVVLYYLYSDLCTPPPNLVCEVIFAADMFLLMGLKLKCGEIIIKNLDAENVFESYYLAKQMAMDLLCEKCIKFIGYNIYELVDTADFCKLLKQEGSDKSANSSFQVLEDICYYIRSSVGSIESQKKANLTFRKINKILQKANLKHLQIVSHFNH